MRRGVPALLATVVLLGDAGTAGAQGGEIVHVGADSQERLTQVVALDDVWNDPGRSVFSAEPRDVVTRTLLEGRGARRHERIDLLLKGAWGTHHLAYDAVLERREGTVHVFSRTDRLAFDVDGDGRQEVVLVERVAEATVRVDEYGDPLPGDASGPFLTSYLVEARYVDRREGSLVEVELPLDPEDERTGRLLDRPLGDALRSVLQQAAADHDFAAHRFEQARYRYRVVREWAERAMTGRERAAASPARPVAVVDPDAPSVLWTAASLREEALPRAFR